MSAGRLEFLDAYKKKRPHGNNRKFPSGQTVILYQMILDRFQSTHTARTVWTGTEIPFSDLRRNRHECCEKSALREWLLRAVKISLLVIAYENAPNAF